ncbi:hypothetical protein DL93DRAFT_659556 [Clavulina sp. PMI_390]|nr:hypothetical protein DL93DRAFT_659556 [Clavulina sp. PMI_390]
MVMCNKSTFFCSGHCGSSHRRCRAWCDMLPEREGGRRSLLFDQLRGWLSTKAILHQWYMQGVCCVRGCARGSMGILDAGMCFFAYINDAGICKSRGSVLRWELEG